MRTCYLIPWYDCNLNCPHCDIHLRKNSENYDKFLGRLNNLKTTPEDVVVFFGGEPLLYKDKFTEIVNTGKVTSVSTNMLLWSEDYALLFKEHKMSIATSYNPQRFPSDRLLFKWADNMRKATNVGIDVIVLITLTPDLFNLPIEKVGEITLHMYTSGVRGFLFEPYIGEQEYHKEADEWLIKFHEYYKNKKYPVKSLILDKIKDWNCDCSHTYTLEPSGRLRKGCPQYGGTNIPDECLMCDKNDVCRPCVLQKTCSYPKKFAEWVKVNYGTCGTY